MEHIQPGRTHELNHPLLDSRVGTSEEWAEGGHDRAWSLKTGAKPQKRTCCSLTILLVAVLLPLAMDVSSVTETWVATSQIVSAGDSYCTARAEAVQLSRNFTIPEHPDTCGGDDGVPNTGGCGRCYKEEGCMQHCVLKQGEYSCRCVSAPERAVELMCPVRPTNGTDASSDYELNQELIDGCCNFETCCKGGKLFLGNPLDDTSVPPHYWCSFQENYNATLMVSIVYTILALVAATPVLCIALTLCKHSLHRFHHFAVGARLVMSIPVVFWCFLVLLQRTNNYYMCTMLDSEEAEKLEILCEDSTIGTLPFASVVAHVAIFIFSLVRFGTEGWKLYRMLCAMGLVMILAGMVSAIVLILVSRTWSSLQNVYGTVGPFILLGTLGSATCCCVGGAISYGITSQRRAGPRQPMHSQEWHQNVSPPLPPRAKDADGPQT